MTDHRARRAANRADLRRARRARSSRPGRARRCCGAGSRRARLGDADGRGRPPGRGQDPHRDAQPLRRDRGRRERRVQRGGAAAPARLHVGLGPPSRSAAADRARVLRARRPNDGADDEQRASRPTGAARVRSAAGTSATTTSNVCWPDERSAASERPSARQRDSRPAQPVLVPRARSPSGCWAVTVRRMQGMDMGPGHGPRRARLVRRRLADDDGRDDAPLAARRWLVACARGRGRAAGPLAPPRTVVFAAGYLLHLARRRACSRTRWSRACARSISVLAGVGPGRAVRRRRRDPGRGALRADARSKGDACATAGTRAADSGAGAERLGGALDGHSSTAASASGASWALMAALSRSG